MCLTQYVSSQYHISNKKGNLARIRDCMVRRFRIVRSSASSSFGFMSTGGASSSGDSTSGVARSLAFLRRLMSDPAVKAATIATRGREYQYASSDDAGLQVAGI